MNIAVSAHVTRKVAPSSHISDTSIILQRQQTADSSSAASAMHMVSKVDLRRLWRESSTHALKTMQENARLRRQFAEEFNPDINESIGAVVDVGSASTKCGMRACMCVLRMCVLPRTLWCKRAFVLLSAHSLQSHDVLCESR